MLKMPLEQAMVVILANAGHGLTVESIARIINRERLYVRADGLPVSVAQVYAAICRNRGVFVKENGRIYLSM